MKIIKNSVIFFCGNEKKSLKYVTNINFLKSNIFKESDYVSVRRHTEQVLQFMYSCLFLYAHLSFTVS